MLIKTAVLFFVFIFSLAYADDDLFKSKTIKFFIDIGTTCAFNENGSYEIEKSKWSKEKSESILLIDNIDLKDGSARFIGNNGSTDLSVLPTAAGLTFMEVTPFGSPMILTIFNKKKDGKYLFVYSRHTEGSNLPIPSQWYGNAKVLEMNK